MTDSPPEQGQPGHKPSLVGRRLLLAGSLLLATGSALAVFSQFGHVFDLISHFRVQYIIALVPMTIVCWWLGGKKTAIVLALVLGLHTVEVARSQYPAQTSPFSASASTLDTSKGRQSIRILSINLLAHNTNASPAVAHIRAIDPDVLLLVEYSPWWRKRLKAPLKRYPHYFSRAQRGIYGVAVFSKFALKDPRVRIFERKSRPSIEVQVESALGPVTLIGTHPPPPRNARQYQIRNKQLRLIAQHVRQLTGPVIVAGDLNITPWSAHFKALAKTSGLRDSRRGFGILPTWPVNKIMLRIPIDHILVSKQIQVLSRHAGGDIGSDHWSVWADLTWPATKYKSPAPSPNKNSTSSG